MCRYRIQQVSLVTLKKSPTIMKMVSLTKIFLFHCDLPFKSVSQSVFKKHSDIWSAWVSVTCKAGEPAENSKWNLKISKVNTHFGKSILMHKAEILSDSLLLISPEQPAPWLVQNQKQPILKHTVLQKNVYTNTGNCVGTLESASAIRCYFGTLLGWATP